MNILLLELSTVVILVDSCCKRVGLTDLITPKTFFDKAVNIMTNWKETTQ
jgi:hypothetical protein